MLEKTVFGWKKKKMDHWLRWEKAERELIEILFKYPDLEDPRRRRICLGNSSDEVDADDCDLGYPIRGV
jgi:hypothetical protein